MNTLKKGLASALVVLGMLGLSGVASASAYTINGGATDVGVLDVLTASATLADSGDATELAWIQGVLGSSYTMTKFDVTDNDWTLADETTSVYATDLGLDAGDYFFIKLGNRSGLPDTHFLFENMDMLAWAVIDLETSFDNFFTGDIDVALKNIGKVSHIGNVGGTPAVPLPAAAWLFGSALLGFMGFSVRRRV
jgi:hypothetical protein